MARTPSSAKTSKAAAAKQVAKAPAKAAPKPKAKPAAAKAPAKASVPAARPPAKQEAKLDWSGAIKKALQEKGGQPNWPGSGDAWKRRNKV